MTKLTRSFYLQPTLTVARNLLGKHLVRRYKERLLVGIIVETEAYRGLIDPASHAYRGKTSRNEVMFWEGGHLYVYFTYGMHFCANVVTRKEGVGEAVLIRAVEPLQGIETMFRNRYGTRSHRTEVEDAYRAQLTTHAPITDRSLINLTNGPAKLCEALAIRRNENGCDLLGGKIYLLDAPRLAPSRIGTSTRIGIVKGTEKKWRFFIRGNECVSRRQRR